MFIIKRLISPYTEADIIISIASTPALAENIRREYIDLCKVNDKWGDQAYREVNLDEDVILQDISTELIIDSSYPTDLIYVVSLFEEGFGQIDRTFHCFTNSESKANNEMEKLELLENTFPSWSEVEKIQVDRPDFNK